MKECDTQRLILDWLAANHILAFRLNVGAMKVDNRFVQFGVKGMADILAFPMKRTGFADPSQWTQPTWIECKATKGVQSAFQKSFQQQVEDAGHTYILAKSLEDVLEMILP